MKPFRTPSDSIGDLSADAAATLIAAAADVALIMDREGVIQDASFQQADLSAELESYGKLRGRHWAEIVTPESQSKIDAMLREAVENRPSRWRQVNHQTGQRDEIPVSYSVVPVGEDRLVALGRDLRSVAKLQERLVEAQMAMERDYSKLRHLETRYRILFEKSSEAVLVVDGASQKIVEANPAALNLLHQSARRVIGGAFAELFETDDRDTVHTVISDTRAAGRAEARARIAATEFAVSASLFRQEASALILVRLVPANGAAIAALPAPDAMLIDLMQHAPDGTVMTDRRGTIVTSNIAFRDLAQLASDEQARGQPLDRWLGRADIDMNVLLANLRQHGSVRLFATVLRGEAGSNTDVEVSAVALGDGSDRMFGFSIRNVGRRISTDNKSNELPHSAEQLTELIGRVPLKDIVRETADVIERLCIEAALRKTSDNRASAAEMLGLSRQSLYVKLRRYGIADSPADAETEDQAARS